MGPGQFFVARVGSAIWFGSEFGKFPLKMSNFFLSGQKNLFGSGRKVPGSKAGGPLFLLRVKSKLGSGRVRSGPISIG